MPPLGSAQHCPATTIWSIWVASPSQPAAATPARQDNSPCSSASRRSPTPTLIAFNVIPATRPVAFAFGAGLLVLVRLGWRVAAATFDRERLITGTT